MNFFNSDNDLVYLTKKGKTTRHLTKSFKIRFCLNTLAKSIFCSSIFCFTTEATHSVDEGG